MANADIIVRAIIIFIVLGFLGFCACLGAGFFKIISKLMKDDKK